MPEVLRFRATWGVDPGSAYAHWVEWFPTLKSKGYHGVEIGITDKDNLQLIREICDRVGLEISVILFSSWPSYVGPRPAGLKPQDHLGFYRSELERVKVLRPFKVNVQSGSDIWTFDESVEFYRGTLKIDAELGYAGKVCHETHRNRSLFTPYAASYILKRVPELRITTDISHWVVICERLLTHEEDEAILEQIIPHVCHIHARTGTTQASQCPDPLNPAFAEEKEFFESFWKRCITSMANRDNCETLTFVPEYGPFPYHPIGSPTSYSELADLEGARLHKVFNESLASA